MTELRFDGRAALVTGSSQGLGLEYARLLAKRGAKVVLNGRTQVTVEQAAREIQALGGNVAIAAGDLSTEAGRKGVLAQALDAFGKLDILINNAGVSKRKALHEITAADYHEILALNLESIFFMIQDVWPHMKENGYGRIINTSSGAGIFGTANHALYGMAKAAVHGLTRVLAVEAVSSGIRINTISPLAATRLANNIPDEDFRRQFIATLPPELCAPLVCWLAHETCEANGEALDVGGGIISRIFTAVTPGYINPKMTIEDVAANAKTIFDESGYIVPRGGETRVPLHIARVQQWNQAN